MERRPAAAAATVRGGLLAAAPAAAALLVAASLLTAQPAAAAGSCTITGYTQTPVGLGLNVGPVRGDTAPAQHPFSPRFADPSVPRAELSVSGG